MTGRETCSARGEVAWGRARVSSSTLKQRFGQFVYANSFFRAPRRGDLDDWPPPFPHLVWHHGPASTCRQGDSRDVLRKEHGLRATLAARLQADDLERKPLVLIESAAEDLSELVYLRAYENEQLTPGQRPISRSAKFLRLKLYGFFGGIGFRCRGGSGGEGRGVESVACRACDVCSCASGSSSLPAGRIGCVDYCSPDCGFSAPRPGGSTALNYPQNTIDFW